MWSHILNVGHPCWWESLWIIFDDGLKICRSHKLWAPSSDVLSTKAKPSRASRRPSEALTTWRIRGCKALDGSVTQFAPAAHQGRPHSTLSTAFLSVCKSVSRLLMSGFQSSLFLFQLFTKFLFWAEQNRDYVSSIYFVISIGRPKVKLQSMTWLGYANTFLLPKLLQSFFPTEAHEPPTWLAQMSLRLFAFTLTNDSRQSRHCAPSLRFLRLGGGFSLACLMSCARRRRHLLFFFFLFFYVTRCWIIFRVI